MGSTKSRLHNTRTDNLLANLRGEVGETILSWILLRYLQAQAAPLRTEDPSEVSRNPFLFVLDALMERLEDDIAARLSELAQPKIGRLNFHFAQRKLGVLEREVIRFADFIERSRIKEKRDTHISHKELPEDRQQHQYLHIDYPVLVKGIAAALRLMKKLDQAYIGPTAIPLWHEMRRKRYDFTLTARAAYVLLPYLRLAPEDHQYGLPNEPGDKQELGGDA